MGHEPRSERIVKLLYHHRTRAQDAQGIHIRELVSALRLLGHEVELVALLASRQSGRMKKKNSSSYSWSVPHWMYELVALGYNVPAFFILLWRTARFRPDVIYERYSIFASAGLLVARLFRVPFFLEVNSPLSLEMKTHESLKFERLAQRMEDWVCVNATRTIVVTGVMKQIFVDRGVPCDRIMVMPNGVDEQAFHTEIDGSNVTERLGLTGAYVVGFVGWIRPWHGVDTLLKAMAEVTGQIPSLKLLIVGDGPAVPALRELSAELGIDEHIVFAGSVASGAIPEYLAAMDVAVQPNVTEYASPIKLFEYLAMGRAVIAPNKANILEVVEDEETALIYEAGDVNELAEKIQRLHDEPELRMRLGSAASKLIRERRYSWVANAERVVEAAAACRSGFQDAR